MKNLHLLPTDKPSRLFIDIDDNKLKITIPIGGEHMMNQHIYITSDEEIKAKEYILIIREGLLIGKLGEIVLIKSTKEGRTDYVRMDGTRGWFASDVNYQKDWNYKKIILTDNKDLIKDGVQAIPDEFLEWFIKNPNCEEVEVESFVNGNVERIYEIIIPKEEPKQETLEEAAEKYADFSNDYVPLAFGSKFNETTKRDFIAGAKWQQERSENDMIEFLDWSKSTNQEKSEYELKCLLSGTAIDSKVLFSIWFEQFKKK